ncbi:MAG: pimeloyl-ACP methyl ester carboxylesterase [Roseivirga sp.]|jgi:pimeloyl-ACP methyl ester carboxylesterase
MSTINSKNKGSGFPVVLLHGFCETAEMWTPFADSLGENYQIICPDLPGFGSSSLLENVSIESAADELMEYLLSLDIQQFVVIGHSLGGYVALAMAEKYPEIVRGLGLLNSNAFADDDDGKHKRDKALLFLKKHPVQKFIAPFIPSLFYEKRKDELSVEITRATEIGLTSKIETVRAYTLAMKNRKDRFEVWKNISTHCLFIGGMNDNRIPADICEMHIEARNHVDGYIIPETAHMAIYERPSETLQMVKDYLLKVN